MPDEENKVQIDTEHEEPVVEAVDYEEEAKKFEKKEQAREFYQKRHEKEQQDQEGSASSPDIAQVVRDELRKAMPAFRASTEAALVENKIDRLSDDPAVRKLIRFHFENTINSEVGSIDDRLEIAYAAANRKKILKTSRELSTALKNRQQIQNNSQGQNSESTAVSDGLLSEGQVKDLKSKGWDDKKIERFKRNLQKNSAR